jgi:hypothetical protein
LGCRFGPGLKKDEDTKCEDCSDAFPVDAALAFVGCGFCHDGAGDAGINHLDAPKVKLCRVSVSRTVWTDGECAASCTTGISAQQRCNGWNAPMLAGAVFATMGLKSPFAGMISLTLTA